MKQFAWVIFILLPFILAACQSESPSETMWLPTLENASFQYLTDTAIRIEEALRLVRQDLEAQDTEAVRQDLVQAEEELLILRHYDIPMTEVRQSVYDAERFFALRLPGRADGDLEHADRILDQISVSGNIVVMQEIDQVRLQISEARIAIGELREQKAPVQQSAIEAIGKALQDVGNRVNLMTMKADLVLSGADFQSN